MSFLFPFLAPKFQIYCLVYQASTQMYIESICYIFPLVPSLSPPPLYCCFHHGVLKKETKITPKDSSSDFKSYSDTCSRVIHIDNFILRHKCVPCAFSNMPTFMVYWLRYKTLLNNDHLKKKV